MQRLRHLLRAPGLAVQLRQRHGTADRDEGGIADHGFVQILVAQRQILTGLEEKMPLVCLVDQNDTNCGRYVDAPVKDREGIARELLQQHVAQPVDTGRAHQGCPCAELREDDRLVERVAAERQLRVVEQRHLPVQNVSVHARDHQVDHLQTDGQNVKPLHALPLSAAAEQLQLAHGRLDHGVLRQQVQVGIAGVRMLGDGALGGEDHVGEDVDLADAARDGVAEIVIRQTRAAVQHEGNRNGLADLAQTRDIELRRRLVDAVARADGDGEEVRAGLVDKGLGFLRLRVDHLVDLAVAVGQTADAAELAFHADAHAVRDTDDLGGFADVLLAGLLTGAVIHDGAEAGAQRLHQKLKVVGVVQMDGDGDLGPAGLLALRHGLTIVTNSAQITPLLADSDNTVYALGGQVRATSLACVGMWTLTALRTLRADIALIGTNGVLGHTGPCTSIYSEAEIKTAMVQCAKKSIVLCDGSKFREEAVIQFADWQQIDCLITDQTAPEAELAVIRQKTTVLVAGT